MSKTTPPTSAWARSTQLLRLGARLAVEEVSGRLRQDATDLPSQRLLTQVAQAKEIVASLGQLKGAAMKAGQLLSMELRDVLPPEVIEILQTLQDSGKAVHFDEIREILEEELGAERMAQLVVEPTPLASASIGQVHRATWNAPNGTVHSIVLKVQFRGVAETIDSDLAVLERIARLFLSVQFKEIDLASVFAELKTVLKGETDYQAELQNLLNYRVHAEHVHGLVVPTAFEELSTRKVLALSFEEGLKLDAFLATAPRPEVQQHTAHQFLDLYFREFFEWGIVQTDANFANFLFRPMPDGSVTLVLLDFGATRTYEPAFIASYQRLLHACFDNRVSQAIEIAESLGLIDPRESAGSKQQLVDLIRIVLRVFRANQQPIDFSDRRLVEEAGAAVRSFYTGLKFSPPPAQLLFLHRKLGGVYSMVKALRGTLDLTPYWQRTAIVGDASV
jgi:aarF domain-containing kinase